MQHYQQLEKIFGKIYHLNHLRQISAWDEAVMMPPGGGHARAKALAMLDGLIHEYKVQPEVGELLQKATHEKLDNNWHQANLVWMQKAYIRATCLPSDLVEKMTQATIHCEQAWRTMRAENNWRDFKPLLENVFHLIKESAKIQSDIFQISPYDALIDQFSPGVNQNLIDPIFAELKNTLPSLIQKIIKQQKSAIEPKGPFTILQQKKLAVELMTALGFDFNRGRIDVSHHPFCGGVPEDVRITTRYNQNDFLSSAMAICHETGHARYEQNLPENWVHLPVGQALGMSVHESQSLLVEMQLCRSKAFMQFLAPLCKNHFGDQKGLDAENLQKLATTVAPGFIRVDADEVTYPLHVILRYELEQQLIEGDLKVADLPDAWNAKMQKYLNLSTENNFKDGVMQDVHWPSGAVGYFPAYTLGSIIAAQLFDQIKKTHTDWEILASQGDFHGIFNWLKQHIHSKASSLSMQQLLKEATGSELSSQYYLNHINNRYLST